MDIWEWVSDTEDELTAGGHERLATIISELPRLVIDGHHEQAEALVPEGLALARDLDHAWIEVFIRHWLAQSRIVRRRDITHGLEEVIRLLDFSHGDRTAACPQSVCVTQDVCVAYGVLDGPGYAEERLAAAAETMARIDVTWPCFQCIAAEHAAALLDAERYEDAERYCREQLKKAASAGQSTPWYVQWHLVDALSAQARHEEALRLLEVSPVRRMEDEERRIQALHRARELAVSGKVDEAVAAQLPASELEPSEYVLWTRAELALCQRQADRNTRELGRILHAFFVTLREHGSLYDLALIGIAAAKLAIARGSSAVAKLYAEDVEALIPRLRRPERIVAALQEIRNAFPRTMSNQSSPDALLSLEDDPERNLERLQSMPIDAADKEAATLARCSAYQQLGFSDRARRELADLARNPPESSDVLDRLLRLLVETGAEDLLMTVIQHAAELHRPRALFYLARLLQHHSRYPEAADALEKAHALEPAQRAIASNLALVYRHLDRYQEALTLLDALTERSADDDEANDDHWERVIVGTLLGEFDKVRASARSLGFTFEGEGPIDEPFAYCDLKLKDEVGRDIVYRAERISPVTARIIALQPPGTPSIYGDEFVFDPTPLNPPSEDDSQPSYLCFCPIKQLRSGGYRTYDIDGIHPGEKALQELESELLSLGVILSVRSSDEYQLQLPGSDAPRRGVYAYLLVPADVDTRTVYERVAASAQTWADPITYRGILAELGLSEELARQDEWADEVDL